MNNVCVSSLCRVSLLGRGYHNVSMRLAELTRDVSESTPSSASTQSSLLHYQTLQTVTFIIHVLRPSHQHLYDEDYLRTHVWRIIETTSCESPRREECISIDDEGFPLPPSSCHHLRSDPPPSSVSAVDMIQRGQAIGLTMHFGGKFGWGNLGQHLASFIYEKLHKVPVPFMVN